MEWQPPLGVHHFVVTHNPPQEWLYEGSPFTFVTNGIESAIKQAKQKAADKHVAISSANILQQCIKLSLVDEIHIDLVPILLGKGIRLFEPDGSAPVKLQVMRAIEGTGVTHFKYAIVK